MILVKKLIQQLKKCDQNAVVIMSSDEEGNSLSPLFQIEQGGKYDKENNEILYPEDCPIPINDLPKAILFWPM